MKGSRFTETQIMAILKEAEAGLMVKEICRKHGISDATYYNWKAKYGGMEASDIKRMKDLKDENRRLKQMFADLSLENRTLKDVIEKKALNAADKRLLVQYLIQQFILSIRAACQALSFSLCLSTRPVMTDVVV